MRIVSLVPHATELLFAIGLGEQVQAVTHECDHPAQARALPRVTRDVLAPGLSAGEIDAAVRERVAEGKAIYELDAAALAACQPDLIVTQALCPVCAVSYEDVAAIAQRLPSRPRVIALDPRTIAETHEDVRTLAKATDAGPQGAQLVGEACARIERVRAAVRGRGWPRVAALEWLAPVFIAGHWTPEMIALAGGEDVAGVAGEPSREGSWEELEAAAPEVVVVMPCGYDAGQAHEEARAHATQLAAIGASRVVAVNASAYFSRPGPRLTDGVELLARILHAGALAGTPAAEQALAVELGG